MQPGQSMLFHMSNEDNPGCLGCIGGYTTILYYRVYIVSHYRNPGIRIKQSVYWVEFSSNHAFLELKS